MNTNWRKSDREARRIMEEAAKHSKGAETADESSEPKVKGYRLRGKLYDKIKVSLKTMDIIVGVVAALLVIAVIVGIVTGNRQQ